MKLNFDTTKPYFNEIKKVSKDIKKVLKSNQENSFIKEIGNSITSNNDIVSGYPKYFKNVLYPLTYDRAFVTDEKIIKKYKQRYGYSNIPAVNKWFGSKGWKNISPIDDRHLIEELKQDHINLIVDDNKRKIAQDFFNFSRVFIENENVIKVPMNVETTLYKFNWIQIRNMAKKYKRRGSYYNIEVDDKDHINYTFPNKFLPGSLITNSKVEYNAKDNIIKLHFYHNKNEIEEIVIDKDTIIDPKPSNYIFLSERLFDWSNLIEKTQSKLHEMFLDDIEFLLTPEIKAAVRSFIKKQDTIKQDWESLKIKYAYKLLEKGNI